MNARSLGVSTRLSGALASALLLGFFAPGVLRAKGRIEGRVLNGTVNRPMPNQEVRLLLPRGGMQPVATVSTDPNGNFVFNQREIEPGAFYLLETEFQGVKYPSPAQFDSMGAATANLTVYESTRSDAALRVQTRRVLVRAEGAKVRVREEYAILNSSNPPRTFANPGGTFRFQPSPRATELLVAVTGLMNMPLPQTPEAGKSPGEFSIRYPLKPGVTTVTVAYEADYSARELALSDRVFYPVDETEMYVSPSTLSVNSRVLKPAGVDPTNDVQKLKAQNLRSGETLEVSLAGEAAAASAQAESGQAGSDVKIVPNSMTQLAAPLLACFLLVLLWALGIRVAKEWSHWQERNSRSPAHKQIEAKVDGLVNSLADLDELFASGKIVENKYWKERLELKARLAAVLKKAPPSLLESYVTRHTGL